MSVTFYDGPDGRLFMVAPVGSGEFKGAATDRDILLNPDAYAAYQAGKAKAASEVEVVEPEKPVEPAPEPVAEPVAEPVVDAAPEPVEAPKA